MTHDPIRRPLRRSVLIAGAAGIASLAAPAFAQTRPRDSVTVGILNSLAEAPTLMAFEAGYFRAENIDVKFEAFQNTADMVAPMSSGQIDVASGALTLGFLNGALRGLPFKLVGDKGRNSKGHGFNALVIRKDLIDSGRVKRMSDLKGLKIATPSRNSPMEIQLDDALKTGGIGLDDVGLEQLNFPNMLAAMSNKAIDGGLLIEPFVALASNRKIGVRFVGFDETSPDFQIAGIIYGPDIQAARADVGRRWMVAYVRGIRDYLDVVAGRQPRSAMIKALALHTNAFRNASLLDDVVMPGFSPDGYLNLKTLKDSIDWYMARSLLRERPEIGKLVDYQYLDYALGRLGRKGPRQSVLG